jgi:hypothetical protein
MVAGGQIILKRWNEPMKDRSRRDRSVVKKKDAKKMYGPCWV